MILFFKASSRSALLVTGPRCVAVSVVGEDIMNITNNGTGGWIEISEINSMGVALIYIFYTRSTYGCTETFGGRRRTVGSPLCAQK
jgi:hypothetical protein